jgi:hypothetical protein
LNIEEGSVEWILGCGNGLKIDRVTHQAQKTTFGMTQNSRETAFARPEMTYLVRIARLRPKVRHKHLLLLSHRVVV